MKFFVFSILFSLAQVQASPVQIEHKGLKLNGNLIDAGSGQSKLIFLIVHGTWAHHGMEIITSLQSLLADSGHDSLAITLSLGVNDRKGFMTCDYPIRANHGDAAAEINRWVEYLESRTRQIIVVGHSRGGNQVALFNQAFVPRTVTHLVLIAPMTWSNQHSAQRYQERSGVDLASVLDRASRNPGRMIRADVLNCDAIEVMAESFQSYYGIEPNRNTPELLVSVDRPVLVVQGTEDELAEAYKAQHSLVESNPLIEDYWIDGAGHFFRDLYADELVEKMLEWIKQ